MKFVSTDERKFETNSKLFLNIKGWTAPHRKTKM